MLRSACLRHPVSGSRWGAWDVISGGVAPGYVISALSGRISAHHGEGLCLDSVQDLEFVTRDVLLEGEHPRLGEDGAVGPATGAGGGGLPHRTGGGVGALGGVGEALLPSGRTGPAAGGDRQRANAAA